MPDAGITIVQLSYLQWLAEQDRAQFDKYQMFRDYYDGEHATQLTDRMRTFLQIGKDQEFTLNFCPIVVDSLVEKLVVLGFECEDENQDKIFRDWWQRNRMDATQSVVHLSSIRDGDSYVLIEWNRDKKIPRFSQQNAYNGTDGVHLVYSDEDRTVPIVGVKRWIETSGPEIKTRRANLYYPDRVEKYTDKGTGGDYVHYIEDSGEFAGIWPIPWTDSGTESGEPLGIPIVHFRNKDQGSVYGESELEDVVPIANGLDKSFIDLLAAADSTGFQMYWASGYDGSGVEMNPAQLLWSTDPNSKWGVLPPAALEGLIKLKDSIAADIAKVTRTPVSFFQLTGQVAAEGTLKEQRSGLNSKAVNRQVVFGNGWEDVMDYGRKLHNIWGSSKMDPEKLITTVWQDDEKPDDTELAAIAESLERSKSASIEVRVKTLHPEWSDEKILEEVERIKEEQSFEVPDLGPLP